MVPGSLRCRGSLHPEPRSRPPRGIGVAAAAGLTRRLLASCCLPSAVCYLLPAAPVCRLLPWPTAVCYLRPSICCPSRPLPSVCRSLSTACCLLPAAFRLPTAVYRLLPVACRLLPAALADRICHLLPAACQPPSATCGLPSAALVDRCLPSAAHCPPPWPTASATCYLPPVALADRHLPHQPSAGPAHPQLHARRHRFGPSTRLSASLRRP